MVSGNYAGALACHASLDRPTDCRARTKTFFRSASESTEPEKDGDNANIR